MTNFKSLASGLSQALASKKQSIIEDWKNRVRQSRRIDNSEEMPETALENDIPCLLDAVIDSLNKSERREFEKVAEASLSHTENRVKHGYNAAEMSREYHLLRNAIFTGLELELDVLSGRDCQEIMRQIDAVVDTAVTQSFDHFVNQRTQSLEEVQKELKNTNEELKRLLEINRDRFSQLAHDFKTPLNSIMGYSQLLLRQKERLEEQEGGKSIEQIERVLRSSRQLLQMVNDVLEIFRYERCEVQLRLTPVNICSFVNETLETIEPLAQEKELDIVKDYDNAPEQVITDLSRLQQILTNLLSNAVRYTETGHIKIGVTLLPNSQWSLTVSDTGIGISKEDQTKIFQPFGRAGSSENKTGSTGLGLAIVTQLVDLLQGKIELISTEGEGSSFMIVFPLEVVR
jgi:signal transduction histidine kinase